MAVYLQCFSRCLGWGDDSTSDGVNRVQQPRVALDTMKMGQSVSCIYQPVQHSFD